MSFAQIDFEVMQELDGVRLSLYLAVRHEEFLDGVCKLSPTELSRKYGKLKNDSNTSRVRKQMISEGWFIEVVGGIVTKKFNTTAKFAGNNKDELQNLQGTAKNAVNGTAKFAGTEIANNDLEFKEFLFIYILSLSCASAPVNQFQTSTRNLEIEETIIVPRTDSLANSEPLKLLESAFKITVGNHFAEEVNSRVKNIDVWRVLIRDKISFADKPQAQRDRIPNWILNAYDEKLEKEAKKNGSNQKPTGKYQSTADKRLQNELESDQLIADLLAEGYAEQENLSGEHSRTIEAYSPPC